MKSATRGRGRPPLTWVSPDRLAELPVGTCVLVDLGDGKARLRGRVAANLGGVLRLRDQAGEVHELAGGAFRRLRVLAALLEPGDPVLLPGVPAGVWRGGVVRAEGDRVLVETLADGLVWFAEADLLSALVPSDRFAGVR